MFLEWEESDLPRKELAVPLHLERFVRSRNHGDLR